MSAWLIMAVNALLLGASCFVVASVVTQIGSEALEPSPLDPAPVRAEAAPERLAATPSLILDRNLFGATLAGDTLAMDEKRDEPLTETKLPLELLGTAAATREERSRAAIEDKKAKKHIVVAVGDRLEGHDRVRVTGIERTRVILDNAGKPEELSLHEDGAVRPVVQRTPPARQARRAPRRAAPTLNERLEDLSGGDEDAVASLLSSARIIPHYEDGKMKGMKVSAIKPDSVFERIGMQNGDIITEVNGIVIDRVDATGDIFEEFAEADTIETAVLRGDEVLTMSATAEDLME
jgi:general secretion pathway protein C